MVSPFLKAQMYRDAGFEGTLPLPLNKKFPPPRGYTGRSGLFPTDAEIADWSSTLSNIALRLPQGVIGVDVDAYGDKHGNETIAELEAKLGPLPATKRSSSREDGISGIYLYTVPPELGYVADLGPGVEVVQYDYRYMVVWPSIHPSGNQYRWWQEDTETQPPNLSELPTLPDTWLVYFHSRQETSKPEQNVAPPEPLQGEALEAAQEYTNAYITAKIAKLTKLPSQGTSVLWDQTVYGVARDLVRLANSWWSPASHKLVEDVFNEACLALRDGTVWDDVMPDKMERAQVEVSESLGVPAEVQRTIAGQISLDSTNEADFEDEIAKIIGTGPLSGIFKRGSELTHYSNMSEGGYIPALVEDDQEVASEVNPNMMVALVDQYYWVYKWMGKKADRHREHVLSPKEAVTRALPRAVSFGKVREIKTLTRTPLIRDDGSIIDSPGYDGKTKSLYLPLRQSDPHPSKWKTAEEARNWLLSETQGKGVWGEFPWSGDNPNDCRATYLAMLMTPILELICPPPWPLFAFTAPDRGSGKSLLTQTAGILYGNTVRGMSQSTEEFRKQVTTILMGTADKLVTFDNVEATVVNDELSRLMTEKFWTDRVLGQNRNATLPNDRVWAITGNNITIGDDQRRRTVWVEIDAGVEKAWERTNFEIKDIKSYIARHWDLVLSALTFMVSEWIKVGCPVAKDAPDRSDEYGHWQRVMNGILAYSGAEGRVGRSERESALVEGDTWAALFAQLALQYRDEPWTVKKLTQDISLRSVIDPITSSQEKNFAISFGKLLQKREAQWHGGYRAVRHPIKKNNAIQWQLQKDGEWPEPLSETTVLKYEETNRMSLGGEFNHLLDFEE